VTFHLIGIAIRTATVGDPHHPLRFFEILFRAVPPAFAMLSVLIIPDFVAVAAHRQKFFIQGYFSEQFLFSETPGYPEKQFIGIAWFLQKIIGAQP
jgi:hypothetical protein